MEELLYETLITQLSKVKEIKMIDFDLQQLMEVKPSLNYPAVLIDIDYPNTQNINHLNQEVRAIIKLTICSKNNGETNSLTPKNERSKGLDFLRIRQKIYINLQGYGTEEFYPLERKSMRNQLIRKGLKTTVLTFETSFHDDSAASS